MAPVDDATKRSSEYDNAANMSREYRSPSNVVQLEGYISCFAHEMQFSTAVQY